MKTGSPASPKEAGFHLPGHRIRFLPEGVWVEVGPEETIRDAALRAGIEIASACGGEGTCGKCRVRVLSGRVTTDLGAEVCEDDREALSCRTRAKEDLTVEIPLESRLGDSRATILHSEVDAGRQEAGLDEYSLNPVVREVSVSLNEPALGDTVSDWQRLSRALGSSLSWQGPFDISISVLRNLPSILRKGDWKVTAGLVKTGERWEVVSLRPGGDDEPCIGLAVDIGTTTVAVYLVDTSSGRTLQRLVTYNGQFVYGEDVITRVVAASRSQEALEEVRQAVLETTNRLIGSALEAAGLDEGTIHCAVVSGNTVMAHLFLGVDPRNIRLEPYVSATAGFPPFKAEDVGIRMNPDGYVLVLPCPGSYVGGDVVAGTLVSRIGDGNRKEMLVDVGTNGEVVLGNDDLLVAAACSMGPAFEGSGISCGMRSVPGAVHRVSIEEGGEVVHMETIGGERPIGICGSGLVELLAAMLDAGVVDMSGTFTGVGGRRIRKNAGDPCYVLLFAEETGLSRDLAIYQSDIKNLIRAKAAMYAGIRYLAEFVGMDLDELEHIYVAGAFGSHLDVEAAVKIGMFPDIGVQKFVVLGNSSVKGSRLAILSRKAFHRMEELAGNMTYVELSTEPAYMDHFVSASFLPHTDLSLFPTARMRADLDDS